MGSRFRVFVDLHNPGPKDASPFFYTSPPELLREPASLDRFLEAGRAEITGPLAANGKTRESGPAYDKNWEKISKNWVSRATGAVAVTLETTWNTPNSTTDNYRRVGRELGCAIERFLR